MDFSFLGLPSGFISSFCFVQFQCANFCVLFYIRNLFCFSNGNRQGVHHDGKRGREELGGIEGGKLQ